MGEHAAASPAELRREVERLRAENRRLRSLLGLDSPEPATAQPVPPPTPA
jgi:cell shape-determining protein MreC